MSTHNNYEPTRYVNYEQTTPNPYLHDTYLPPPPPEYYMHQRGKAWKVFIPVVLIILGVAVGILAYPTVSGMISPSADTTSKTIPYAPFSMPAVTAKPTVNTNYTARDIMQDIINTGFSPRSVTYDESLSGWIGYPISVNASSSVDITEGPVGTEPSGVYGILVYRNYADTKQAYEDALNDSYQSQLTPPTGPTIGIGTPYYHGRCLLLGSDETSVYAQVMNKYCV